MKTLTMAKTTTTFWSCIKRPFGDDDDMVGSSSRKKPGATGTITDAKMEPARRKSSSLGNFIYSARTCHRDVGRRTSIIGSSLVAAVVCLTLLSIPPTTATAFIFPTSNNVHDVGHRTYSSSPSSSCTPAFTTTTRVSRAAALGFEQTTALHATKPKQTEEQKTQDNEQEESSLSDVDARVLREILQDSKKLDLETEQGIRDLLKRGTVKTVVDPSKKEEETADDSEYESSAMKAFTDSKLWKKLSLRAEDLLESAKIWIENKVEKDVQTLAALGLFAWERAVKDVSRALPAAGTSARKLLQLSNSSSFTAMQEEQERTMLEERNRLASLKEELNRPADEIKTVTRAIFDILSGQEVDSSGSRSGGGRGLRTTAPAGISNMAERQRRALKQRRKLDKQEKDVTRVAGGVIDSAYELRREMKAETNVAGYKTKPIRQAIEAGVVGTGRILQAVQETARLAAAKRRAERLAASSSASATVSPGAIEEQPIIALGLMEDELLLALQQERLAVDERLSKCITEPENTWLSTNVVTQATLQDLSEDSLREIATIMVLVRDEMDAQVQADGQSRVDIDDDNNDDTTTTTMDDGSDVSTEAAASSSTTATIPELMEQLRADLGSIKELRSRVAGTVSFLIAEQLYNEILGLPMSIDTEDDVETVMELPLILRLEEIQEQLDNPPLPPPPPPPQPEATAMPFVEQEVAVEASAFTAPANFVDVTNVKARSSPAASRNVRDGVDVTATTMRSSSPSVLDAEDVAFVDVIPDAFVGDRSSDVLMDAEGGVTAEVVVDVGGQTFSAEIVTDDDFDTAVGEAKRVTAVANDGTIAEGENENQEPNMVTVVVLRSLDVVFFVFEKFFTVAVPKTLIVGTNIARRLQEAQQEGKGSQGWRPIRQSVSAKGRY